MVSKYLFLLFFIFSSCSLFERKDKQKPIARTFDNYLYQSEISGIIPSGISTEDSISWVNNYINNWIRQNLILHKAERNLTEERKDFEKQLEDYRRSLIIYAYEKELVKQLLDTVVSEEEIEKYYEGHKQNFELKDNIIKVYYIKVDKKAPNLKKLQKWYRSDNPEDIIDLENYCYQYAQNFYLDDNTWLLFEDLLKEVPIITYNKEDYLKKNTLIELEDDNYFYFVNIKGFKIKNTISPLSFEKENIINIIINKRKIELIEKMKKDIYEYASINKDFEIYAKE